MTKQKEESTLATNRSFVSTKAEHTSKEVAPGMSFTSIYDGDIEALPSCTSSVFTFLAQSGFSSLLPFLSIVLFKKGFAWSQIGTINSITYFTSSLFGSLWCYVTRKYNDRKEIMLISITSWLIFMFPLFFFEFYETQYACQSFNATVQEKPKIAKEDNTSKMDDNLFSTWSVMDYPFLLVITFFVSGRIFQSATDYYNFDSSNDLLLRIDDVTLIKESRFNSFLINSASSSIAIFIGCVLDSVDHCDESFGYFQSAFCAYTFFLSIGLLTLFFTDVAPYTSISSSDTPPKHKRNSKHHSKWTVQKGIINCCVIIVGASRGVHYTFLYLRMHSVNAVYLQIGIAFMVHKTSEALGHSLRSKILSRIGMVEVLIITLCSEAIRNFLYSYISSSTLAWIVIPMETLTGFSVLLPAVVSLQNSLEVKTKTNQNAHKHFYVLYWCIGFSFGPIIFGFSSDAWTSAHAFQSLSLINLTLSITLAFTLFLSRKTIWTSPESTDDEESTDDDGNISSSEFLKPKAIEDGEFFITDARRREEK